MTVEKFTQLHQAKKPLVVANVWDVASAQAAMQTGYQAIGTSSAAIASMLGYPDGEKMPLSSLLFMVERIASCVDLPLTVDLESGFDTDPIVVANTIKELAKLGVVGINIEDSVVGEQRVLKSADEFASFLSHIKHELSRLTIDIFINVRTDTFIIGTPNTLEDTIKRATLYHSVGADGIFVPCITQLNEIQQLCDEVNLPLNVMCMPDLANFDQLQDVGVKRISMGNFVFDAQHAALEERFKAIIQQGNFSNIFN